MQSTEQEKLTGKENITQITKFLLFSISAGIIQVIVFSLMLELLHIPYWGSYLTALIVSVFYNFTINRRFTFKSINNISLAMIQLGIYYAIFAPLSTWWGDALVGIGWHDYLVLGLTMVANLVTEFCVCRFIIYRNSMNTRVSQTKKDTPQPILWGVLHEYRIRHYKLPTRRGDHRVIGCAANILLDGLVPGYR